MSVSEWPPSPLAAVERAFDLLTCQPAPLAFDARPFDGLPDAILPLDELRGLLLQPGTGVGVRDCVWRDLVVRARRDGPAWVVAAVGMALPGLRRMAGLLAAGWRGDTDDLDAELLAGFLARLQTVDLDAARICGRLIDAAVRTARKARDRYSDTHLIRIDAAESRLPLVPWDHPELVLVRAVAAGVLEREHVDMIASTRLGRATLAQAAEPLHMSAAEAGAWRHDGELRLRDAIRDGELDFMFTTRKPKQPPTPPNSVVREPPVGPVLGSRRPRRSGSGSQQGPLVGKRSVTPVAGLGVPGVGAAPAV